MGSFKAVWESIGVYSRGFGLSLRVSRCRSRCCGRTSKSRIHNPGKFGNTPVTLVRCLVRGRVLHGPQHVPEFLVCRLELWVIGGELSACLCLPGALSSLTWDPKETLQLEIVSRSIPMKQAVGWTTKNVKQYCHAYF